MNTPDPRPPASPAARWKEDDFAFAAALREATEVPEAPASLYRRWSWGRQAGAAGGAAVALALAAWGFLGFVYPPPLVREALVHEEREATLRGDFQPDKAALRQALGLPAGASVPGLLQLQRPCEIEGRRAYHVTTFLEKGGGIVTILAFDQALPEAPSGQGRWLGRYWRFAQVGPGRTVLLLADNAPVLAETERLLRSG